VLLALVTVVYLFACWQGLVKKKPLGRADAMWGALLVVIAISTLTHDWSLNGSQPLSRLVFYFLAPATLYWLVRQSNLGSRQLAMTFGFFTVFGLYLAVTAFAEANQMWWLVYPRYIASPKFEEFFGRGRGPLLNPVGDGLYMIAGLACLSTFWPDSRSRQSFLGIRARQSLVLALSVILLAGLYFTLTRSIWLAAAMVLVLVVGTRIPRSARLPVAFVSLIFAGGLVALNWGKMQSFKRDREDQCP
jgi:hypothetical protein